MVSNSPTQVAPLPTMPNQEKDSVRVHVSSETPPSDRNLSNGHAAGPASKLPPTSQGNGSGNSTDSISELHNENTGDSTTRSTENDLRIPETIEEFVDAPQGAEEYENKPKNTANDDEAVKESPKISINPSDQLRPDQLKSQKSSYSKRAAAAAAELNDDVLVGTRVSEGHENFVTAYNMLTGIRVAVSRCTAKINRPLTDADFSATDEISFDMSGGSNSPSSKYIFQFKDYAPWVFRHLRDVFRLDPVDYLMSLTAKYIVSELGSPGKSGSFFYYSRDYRFIIKTIRHSEHKLLRRILSKYFSHVKNNRDTLISQFYGLHRVRLPFGRKIHFVVMNNVFPALYEIHERYDLKGSLLGREYHPNLSKPIVVYKDLDWLRRHRRIVLGPEKRERLVSQLEKDIKFLERINVMDYSLLIGIHDMRKGNAALKALLRLEEFGPKNAEISELERKYAAAAVNRNGQNTRRQSHDVRSRSAQKDFAELQTLLEKAAPEKLKEFDFADEYRSEFYFYHDHGGFQSTDDRNEELDVIYYIGVIDFLTGYTFRKSVETFCKSLIHDRRELSAVPSQEYGDRFLKFLRGCIGPAIPSTIPQKKATVDSNMSNVASQDTDPSATYSENDQHVVPFPGMGASNSISDSEPSTATTTPPESVVTIKPSSPEGCTAITRTDSNGMTTAKPSPKMPDNHRRPSVLGYGPEVMKDH